MLFEPNSNFRLLERFFSRFFVMAMTGLVLLGAWLWISAFYFQKNLLGIWSFTLNDIPWMPPPTLAAPIFAGHFFGDFQLPIAYSQLSDPYNPTFLFGGGLPLTFFLFKIFVYIPLVLSFLFFVGLSLTLLFGSIYKILNNYTNIYIHFGLTILIGFLNLPILIALDRGNFLVIAIAILVFSLYFGMINHGINSGFSLHFAAFLFMVSASMKLYFICFLIPIWFCRSKYFAYLSILYFSVGNIFCALLIKFNFLYVTESIKNSLLYQTGNSDIRWLMSGVGFPSLFSNIYIYYTDIERSTAWLALLGYKVFAINLIWFLLVCYICSVRNLAMEIKLIWVLSLVQFAPPIAMAYNLMWCIPAVALLFRFLKQPMSANVLNLNSVKILAVPLFLSLLPVPSVHWRLLSPTIWLVTIVIQIYLMRRDSRHSKFLM